MVFWMQRHKAHCNNLIASTKSNYFSLWTKSHQILPIFQTSSPSKSRPILPSNEEISSNVLESTDLNPSSSCQRLCLRGRCLEMWNMAKAWPILFSMCVTILLNWGRWWIYLSLEKIGLQIYPSHNLNQQNCCSSGQMNKLMKLGLLRCPSEGRWSLVKMADFGGWAFGKGLYNVLGTTLVYSAF